MPASFKMTLDKKDVENKLKGTSLKMRSVSKKVMSAINREVIKQAKQNFKNNFTSNPKDKLLETRADDGYKPIMRNFKQWNAKKQEFTSYVSNRTFYAKFLENGATIIPKKSKYLVFKVNGEFKKSQGVMLSARPFLGNATEDVWNSATANQLADEVLNKELTKYWSKASAE